MTNQIIRHLMLKIPYIHNTNFQPLIIINYICQTKSESKICIKKNNNFSCACSIIFKHNSTECFSIAPQSMVNHVLQNKQYIVHEFQIFIFLICQFHIIWYLCYLDCCKRLLIYLSKYLSIYLTI